jgi:hypothetical protein
MTDKLCMDRVKARAACNGGDTQRCTQNNRGSYRVPYVPRQPNQKSTHDIEKSDDGYQKPHELIVAMQNMINWELVNMGKYPESEAAKQLIQTVLNPNRKLVSENTTGTPLSNYQRVQKQAGKTVLRRFTTELLTAVNAGTMSVTSGVIITHRNDVRAEKHQAPLSFDETHKGLKENVDAEMKRIMGELEIRLWKDVSYWHLFEETEKYVMNLIKRIEKMTPENALKELKESFKTCDGHMAASHIGVILLGSEEDYDTTEKIVNQLRLECDRKRREALRLKSTTVNLGQAQMTQSHDAMMAMQEERHCTKTPKAVNGPGRLLITASQTSLGATLYRPSAIKYYHVLLIIRFYN